MQAGHSLGVAGAGEGPVVFCCWVGAGGGGTAGRVPDGAGGTAGRAPDGGGTGGRATPGAEPPTGAAAPTAAGAVTVKTVLHCGQRTCLPVDPSGTCIFWLQFVQLMTWGIRILEELLFAPLGGGAERDYFFFWRSLKRITLLPTRIRSPSRSCVGPAISSSLTYVPPGVPVSSSR